MIPCVFHFLRAVRADGISEMIFPLNTNKFFNEFQNKIFNHIIFCQLFIHFLKFLAFSNPAFYYYLCTKLLKICQNSFRIIPTSFAPFGAIPLGCLHWAYHFCPFGLFGINLKILKIKTYFSIISALEECFDRRIQL